MDEEEYHLQSKFYYPEDLETSEAGICESRGSHWGFYKQTEKWKHKRKRSTDMNTLLRFIEANGLNSQTIESLPSSELDHLLSISFFFMNVRRKNGEYEPATFSSFQRNIYSDTSLRRNIHSTYSRIMSSKIEKSCSCEAQVTSSRARQKKRAASRSGDWRKRRRCSFWGRRIWRLQSSCTTKNCVVVFIPTLGFPSQRWERGGQLT